jgi:hypothetical protein
VRIATSLVLFGFLSLPVHAAEVISFDEMPAPNANEPTLSEEYAHLGVHFSSADDGSVWDGVTHGDPGGWELEGTNGSAFAGFNGSSFRMSAHFDAPVPKFRVDVSAASGATPGGTFAVEGYRGGVMVERTGIVLGAVNEWKTIELAAQVDRVDFVGDTRGFRPFGVDNLQWGIDAPTRLDVAIDVRPDSQENPVNPGSNGMLPVALLGASGFDVMQVDPESLALGVAGAPARDVAYQDANGDGLVDLVAHYPMPQTGTAYGDTSMCLTGATLEGVELAGCDTIRTVPQAPAAAKARKR